MDQNQNEVKEALQSEETEAAKTEVKDPSVKKEEPKDHGNLHVVSFVSGLVGFLTGSGTILLGIILGIMAIVCAVKQKKRTGRYETMSIVGMVLGIIGLVGAIGALVVLAIVALIYGGAFVLGSFAMIAEM